MEPMSKNENSDNKWWATLVSSQRWFPHKGLSGIDLLLLFIFTLKDDLSALGELSNSNDNLIETTKVSLDVEYVIQVDCISIFNTFLNQIHVLFL